MKTNTIAVATALTIGGTALFANTEAHQWNLTVEQAPALCSFSDNIPVELVSNPTTGRFELDSAGSLTIAAQGMEEISYVTDNAIWRDNGEFLAAAEDWDFSQISLAGSNGNVESELACSSTTCLGTVFTLPDISSDTYALNVEGSLAIPDQFTLIEGEKLYVNFFVQCSEN